MTYTHVLLDLDHTLFDTESSLRLAFRDAMAIVDVDMPDQYDTFDRINQALWRRVEAQELSPPQVHITRFRQLVETLNLDADPQEMADAFSIGMGRHGELYPGANEMLDVLHRVASLAMITNGLAAIQRARIERLGLAQYFDVVTISAEVGCSKPGTEIFDLTFEALGQPDQTRALMVGDSLASDIAGGSNAAIDTCWFNPHAKPLAGDVTPTYSIASLGELVSIVSPDA